MFDATIKFAPSNITALKKELRKQYANVRSSHVDEALDASFRFRTYAAMRLGPSGGFGSAGIQSDPCLLLLRLKLLGYSGTSVRTLRRLTWEAPYPDRWQDDDTERALRKGFVPIAANSQVKTPGVLIPGRLLPSSATGGTKTGRRQFRSGLSVGHSAFARSLRITDRKSSIGRRDCPSSKCQNVHPLHASRPWTFAPRR